MRILSNSLKEVNDFQITTIFNQLYVMIKQEAYLIAGKRTKRISEKRSASSAGVTI